MWPETEQASLLKFRVANNPHGATYSPDEEGKNGYREAKFIIFRGHRSLSLSYRQQSIILILVMNRLTHCLWNKKEIF